MAISKRLSATCGIAAAIALLAAVPFIRNARGSMLESASASAADVRTSLSHGVAWIWPDSNGPRRIDAANYPEAAVLVESLVLRGGGVEHGGRTVALDVPAGVRILPVLHVEVAADEPAQFTPTQVNAVLAAARRQAVTAANGAGMLQLDFEVPSRQREAYQALVASVRQALPANIRLSVTALAHWCTQGDWLDHLPVDEVVPMVYRLGPQAAHWRSLFARADSSLSPRCRGPALGFATNDAPPSDLLQRTARPYWFDETAWSNPSRPPRFLAP